MVRAEVPDTSVMIEIVRHPSTWQSFRHSLASGRIWLSTVVTAELYAGTRSRDDAALVDQMVGALERVGRVLVPTASDWARAGRLIARRIRLQGALRPRDHLADVLLVVSAARVAGSIVTANQRHIASWVELARGAGLDVSVGSWETL